MTRKKFKEIFFVLSSCRKSAPKFLLEAYKNLNDEANENLYNRRHERSTDSDEGENFITDVDKAAIEQSDIITTFLNKSMYYIDPSNFMGFHQCIDSQSS